MKRMLVVCALVGMLLVPAAFAADPTPADFKNAAKYCKAVRESKGVEPFQTLYGKNANKKNAFGKCVSTTAKAKAEKPSVAWSICWRISGPVVCSCACGLAGLANWLT